MDAKLFAELMESANEALEHAQGRRELRTTVLPPVPRPMTGAAVRRLRRRMRASQERDDSSNPELAGVASSTDVILVPGGTMVREVKLRRVGGSLGATLPKEMVSRMRVEAGDRLLAVETADGVLLTPYDPVTEAALAIAARTAKKYRHALRELAK